MHYIIVFTLCLLSGFTIPSQAAWELDTEKSWIHFVSIKSGDIPELGFFKQFSGKVNDEGEVSLQIDLSSVDTNIAVRDERMQEFLFKTDTYPKATLSTTLDLAFLDTLAPGDLSTKTLPVILGLHGNEHKLDAHLLFVQLSADRILVTSQAPLLLDASQFDLVKGIEKLREIAGLPSISKAVPVTVALTFKQL